MRISALFGLILISLSPAAMQTKPSAKTVKPASKTSPTPAKAKSTPKKPVAKKAETPSKAGNETADWNKAIAQNVPEERVEAIMKFVATYPKSKKIVEATELIVKTRAEIGNAKLVAGDVTAAAKQFTLAVDDAPKVITDQLFADPLSKFAASLYGRGGRNEAIAIAKLLEARVSEDPTKLLTIANFYLSVEDGIDARRTIDAVLKSSPDSSAAYQALGLAHRVEFELEESAAAYARALELDPNSVTARRGLAESKRSLGKPDEALSLYREILEKDPTNIAARTGLILSLFDSGKRAEAETELDSAIKNEQGNVILYAGVAYWYASQKIGDKAVDYGQRGITADPRFIWSHIAQARGYSIQNNFAEAEKTLMIARKYGNFPTLDYELANVRMASGFYREAAETLDSSFAVEGDKVATDLGFRVRRSAKDLIELVGFERRSSIFAANSGDDLATAERLKWLLDFVVKVESSDRKPEAIKAAAEQFISGDDASKVFRRLFVASQMVSKKALPEMALTLTKEAVAGVDLAISQPNAPTAVLADELYFPRTRSAANGEIVIVPSIPKQTLSSIVRGRIEEISGSAMLQLDRRDEAIIRFRRASTVLPADSSWWRTSTWQLASALDAAGQNAEAIELYYKSYRSGAADPIKYSVIESLYRRINGNADGLEAKIGANPLNVATTEPEVTEPQPKTPVEPEATPTPPIDTKLPELVPAKPDPSPTPQTSTTPEPIATPTEVIGKKTEAITTEKPKELFPPVVITVPQPDTKATADSTSPPTKDSIKPCVVTSSEEAITIQNSGSEIAVIIGTESDEDLTDISATSSSSADILIRREPITAVKTKGIFIVRSISTAKGVFRAIFALPCGKREINVTVN